LADIQGKASFSTKGNYKYILNATAGRDELYDLSADAMEQKNIAEKDPEQAKRMRQHVAAWVEQQGKRNGK
jgi:hypothetical protein